MSTANDLTERMERETGCRIDSNGGDNAAIAGLMGAVRREMGNAGMLPKTPWHTERDDVAVGMYLKATSTPEYIAKQDALKMMCSMIGPDMGPDELRGFFG